jgi:hypothetical protein
MQKNFRFVGLPQKQAQGRLPGLYFKVFFSNSSATASLWRSCRFPSIFNQPFNICTSEKAQKIWNFYHWYPQGAQASLKLNIKQTKKFPNSKGYVESESNLRFEAFGLLYHDGANNVFYFCFS